MRPPHWDVGLAATGDLPDADLRSLRRLMAAAFGDAFSEEDWRHAIGGTHFLIRDRTGTVVSHASVVGRRMEVSGVEVLAGYVEAVATLPRLEGQGLATAVMLKVGAFLQDRFDLGALSSGKPGFYERLGWRRWRGPTWCREEGRLVRTAHEDGGVLVLTTSQSPPLDLGGDIAVGWRSGDVW